MELSQHEQQKYLVIKEYVDGKLSRKQAAVKLSVCVKTISILKSNYLTNGKSIFSHGLRVTERDYKILCVNYLFLNVHFA